MNKSRILFLTTLAMIAFAGNSILCRLALADTQIDAASFTAIRIVSGGIILWLIVHFNRALSGVEGNSWSALTLFVYAAGFSYAYRSLPAGTGALLLFGAVQATMILYGFWKGERFRPMQLVGFLLAITGLVGLLLPGAGAPPLVGALLMLSAGVAWGVYSLGGQGAGHPLAVTAGNFLRAIPFVLVLAIIQYRTLSVDVAGMLYAVLSGAITSGVGYAIWYSALPGLKAVQAASVQLSVPVIAAAGGILLLGESLSLRLLLASVAILGGIVLVIREKRRTT